MRDDLLRIEQGIRRSQRSFAERDIPLRSRVERCICRNLVIQANEETVLVNYVRRFVDEFVNAGIVNWIVAHPEVCISFWVCCDSWRQLRRLRQHGGTERRAWNKSGLGKIFELPEALVIQKEEGLVSFYRPPSVNPY